MKRRVLLLLALTALLLANKGLSAQATQPISSHDKPTISQNDEQGTEEPCPDPDGDGTCDPLPPMDD